MRRASNQLPRHWVGLRVYRLDRPNVCVCVCALGAGRFQCSPECAGSPSAPLRRAQAACAAALPLHSQPPGASPRPNRAIPSCVAFSSTRRHLCTLLRSTTRRPSSPRTRHPLRNLDTSMHAVLKHAADHLQTTMGLTHPPYDPPWAWVTAHTFGSAAPTFRPPWASHIKASTGPSLSSHAFTPPTPTSDGSSRSSTGSTCRATTSPRSATPPSTRSTTPRPAHYPAPNQAGGIPRPDGHPSCRKVHRRRKGRPNTNCLPRPLRLKRRARARALRRLRPNR